jgi:hypothetical protein
LSSLIAKKEMIRTIIIINPILSSSDVSVLTGEVLTPTEKPVVGMLVGLMLFKIFLEYTQ